jgi:hypothetical protein
MVICMHRYLNWDYLFYLFSVYLAATPGAPAPVNFLLARSFSHQLEKSI